MNDRALRSITGSLGGVANGFPREDGFDITVASEVMAVFCLSRGLPELQARLGKMIVAQTRDGKNITGMINPGTDNIPIKTATLNPTGWLVHFEADAKDKSGTPLTYVIDGKIENLGLYNRSIVGTWSHDAVKGDFKISRQ